MAGMVRSLAVVVFIAGVGAAAIYVGLRPTLARGAIVGADLIEANKATVKAMACDDSIEIGVDGARFACRADFIDGSSLRLEFQMDRAGTINQAAAQPSRGVKPSSDPWAE